MIPDDDEIDEVNEIDWPLLLALGTVIVFFFVLWMSV